MADTLYDDTYGGPRWTYGLTYRPAGVATLPKGWIVFSVRPHPDYRFGTVDFPFALMTEQREAYELTALTRQES